MKNKIEAKLQNNKANDEEEERKRALGFYCERYIDIVKKRELIHLYTGKQFLHGRIKKP